MARQHKRVHSTAVAALIGLGVVILIGKIDGPVTHLTNLLGAGAREGLKLLPYLVPAVWQALQAYAFDHQWFSACPLQMLVSFWPLLHVITGAA